MKTQKIDTITAIEKVRNSAKHMPEMREVSLEIGQVARQGDIYIERVASIQGQGNPIASRQLAPGTTKGSRHIVGEGPKLFQAKPNLGDHAQFQVGPAIEAGVDFTVTHPEHAWIKIVVGKAKQFFQVWFQADYARKTRAQD